MIKGEQEQQGFFLYGDKPGDQHQQHETDIFMNEIQNRSSLQKILNSLLQQIS
jgi:hypothetical protein